MRTGLYSGNRVLIHLDPIEVLENEIERVKKELKAAVKAGKPRKVKKLKEKISDLIEKLDYM